MVYIPEDIARKYAKIAYEAHFESGDDFDVFVSQIDDDVAKCKFLQTGALYLFMVKAGNWEVDLPDSNRVIQYFTNSYKLVTIFSLIESLSTDDYIDFFQWLNKRERRDQFPIERSELQRKYDEYKSDYGSIRKCRAFFESLPNDQKTRLVRSIEVRNGELSLEQIAEFLHNLRSRYVHEGDFVLELGGVPHVTPRDGTYWIVNLSIDELMNVFEIGVIEFFRGGRK